MIRRYFEFDRYQTDYRQETIAGVTTFVTMAYIIVVNPQILAEAGIPLGACTVATILTAFIGTLLMGVYAKRPLAIAPYMGENVFVAFTLCKVMGYSWQSVLGAVFVSALIFALLTMLKIRSWLVAAIPVSMKISFSAGIGLFLSFIGLVAMDLVILGVPDAPVQIGVVTSPTVLLGITGFLLIGVLMIRKVMGAILLGIILTTAFGMLTGHVRPPNAIFSMPPSLEPTWLALDIPGSLQWEFFPIIFTLFIILFVDTMGTLIGVSYTGSLLDKDGNLPDIEKPMLCDSIATMAGAAMGTTAAGAYIESAAGIESGGRTGFTSIVTAFLFLIALFLAPLLTVVPAFAYGPALVIVGMQMLSPMRDIDYGDLTELIPIFVVIALVSFTYNLGMGMAAGFIIYPLMKLAGGRAAQITPGMWLLAALSVVFFALYPYPAVP